MWSADHSLFSFWGRSKSIIFFWQIHHVLTENYPRSTARHQERAGIKSSVNHFILAAQQELVVYCCISLFQNIPSLQQRLHNILWGRMIANFYLSFQRYRHEDLRPQQAQWAHQQPCQSSQDCWVKLPRWPHQAFQAQWVDCQVPHQPHRQNHQPRWPQWPRRLHWPCWPQWHR